MYFSIPELEYTLTQGNQELVPSQSWRRHFCYLSIFILTATPLDYRDKYAISNKCIILMSLKHHSWELCRVHESLPG